MRAVTPIGIFRSSTTKDSHVAHEGMIAGVVSDISILLDVLEAMRWFTFRLDGAR